MEAPSRHESLGDGPAGPSVCEFTYPSMRPGRQEIPAAVELLTGRGKEAKIAGMILEGKCVIERIDICKDIAATRVSAVDNPAGSATREYPEESSLADLRGQVVSALIGELTPEATPSVLQPSMGGRRKDDDDLP